MSRKIKFRAWQTNVGDYNKETKEFTPRPTYFYGRDVILDGNGQLLSVESGWDIQGVEEPKDYTLEQYTGLKDQNGKEIYEGDIVNVIGTGIAQVIDSPTGEWVLYYKRESDEVNNGSVSVVPRNKPSGLWKTNTTSYIEVIGNIHENKELLEGED